MWLREKKTNKQKNLKSLIGFFSANKIDNYNRAGKGKRKKNPKESTKQVKKIRITDAFLESLLSESFPSLGVTVHLTSLDALQHCAGLWTCYGGSSDSSAD